MSPRSGRGASPPRSRMARPSHGQSAANAQSQAQPAPEPEMELELLPEQPVVESLAARRAKRQAIMAKYAGIASQGPTPSPGPSSAVEPPPATPDVSNLPSQAHSVAGTPGPSESVRGQSVRGDSAGEYPRSLFSNLFLLPCHRKCGEDPHIVMVADSGYASSAGETSKCLRFTHT